MKTESLLWQCTSETMELGRTEKEKPASNLGQPRLARPCPEKSQKNLVKSPDETPAYSHLEERRIEWRKE